MKRSPSSQAHPMAAALAARFNVLASRVGGAAASALPALRAWAPGDDAAIGQAVLFAVVAGLATILVIRLLARPVASGPLGKRPPRPPGHWLLGHLPLLTSPIRHTALTALARSHGPVFTLSLAGSPVDVITSPDGFAAFMGGGPSGRHDKCEIHTVLETITGGPGIFSELDITSLHRRKQLRPAFTMAKLKALVPYFSRKARELGDWVESQGATPVDFEAAFKRLTLDVIAHATMAGFEMNAIQGGEPGTSFIRALDFSLEEIAGRWIFMPWRRHLSWLLPAVARAHKDTAANISVAKAVLAHARAAGTREGSDPESVAGLMLSLSAPDGGKVSDSTLVADILTFLVAGADTTAASLAYVMHEIAHRPAVQARLHAEVDSVLAARGTSGDDRARGFTAEELQGMAFHGAVWREVTRMHPVAHGAGQFRRAARDVAINGFGIPKGRLVMAYALPAMVDAGLGGWAPPVGESSADPFDPDRWMGKDAGDVAGAAAYLPFSVGPRDCVGQSLALLEARAAMAEFTRRFAVRPAPGYALTEVVGLLLHPRDGVMLVATPRAAR